MLRKKKNKHRLPQIDLNITSLMDILTTLLFFILMVMTFNKLSILEGSSLKSGVATENEEKKVFALKIQLENSKKAEIFLGPIEGLKMVDERSLLRFLNSNFKGNINAGFKKTVWGKDAKQLLGKLQDAVIAIKKGFPHENKVVISVDDKVDYQTMIDSMSALKMLDEKEAFELTNFLGKTEKTKVLFPEVILAEK